MRHLKKIADKWPTEKTFEKKLEEMLSWLNYIWLHSDNDGSIRVTDDDYVCPRRNYRSNRLSSIKVFIFIIFWIEYALITCNKNLHLLWIKRNIIIITVGTCLSLDLESPEVYDVLRLIRLTQTPLEESFGFPHWYVKHLLGVIDTFSIQSICPFSTEWILHRINIATFETVIILILRW